MCRIQIITMGGKKKADGAMKLLGMAVFTMLLTAGLAARTTPLAPVTAAIKNHEMASRSGFVVGCNPKVLAIDLIMFCREPINAPFPVEACCGAAVGTVARPSCFCLVKKEPAFGMSPLFNVTHMENMLNRCGASLYLMQTLYNPCDGSHKEELCPSPVRGSHIKYMVLSYLEWGVVALLMAVICYLILRQPAAEPKAICVPKEEGVLSNAMAVLNGDGPRNEDDRLYAELVAISDDTFVPKVPPRILAPQNAKEDEVLSHEISVFNDDGHGDEADRQQDEITEIYDDVTSEDVLIHKKRIPVANPKFMGGQWVNNSKPRRRGVRKNVKDNMKGGASNRGSQSNKRPRSELD